MAGARVIDTMLEVPVVPSFTRVGYDIRSRVEGWRPLADGAMAGRRVVLTGATSGLGRAAAFEFVRLGAELVIVGRDPTRTDAAAAELRESRAGAQVSAVHADLGDLQAVRRASTVIADLVAAVDVLVHNAGALSATRRVGPQGVEQTIASQVLGPFLMTTLLLDRLRAATPGRVLTMSSGGMYAVALDVAHLQMSPQTYRGAEQYARAKRAQVTLNEEWARRIGSDGVVFHAVHPGWADTPGVAESLPTFRRLLRPVLRTPLQGVDTLLWLAAGDDAIQRSGSFWLDRRIRPTHRLPTTRRADTAAERERLWQWCVEQTGVDPFGTDRNQEQRRG